MKGSKVLYVGSVDEDVDNLRKHESLHPVLAEHARSVVGVYRSEDHAARLRAAGQHAVVADVERMDLDETFDVVAAADTVEHLSNCGLFFGRVRAHLNPGGSLLISTPNPTSLVRILELLVHRRTRANVAHTVWFSRQVLEQLGRRYGFRVVEEVFIDDMHRYHAGGEHARSMSPGKKLLSRSLVVVNRVVCALLPQFSETHGFVLRADGDPEW